MYKQGGETILSLIFKLSKVIFCFIHVETVDTMEEPLTREDFT